MKSQLSSDRLQKPLTALRQSGDKGLTPMELNQICGSTRASSDLSELRQHGIPLEKIYEGITDNGRKLFRYRLAATPEQAAEEWDKASEQYAREIGLT